MNVWRWRRGRVVGRCPTDLKIRDHLLDDAAIDTRAAEAKGGQQGVIADDADRARQTTGYIVNLDDGFAREQAAGVTARKSDASGDEGGGLVHIESRQDVAQADALTQWLQRRIGETQGKLRLTGEHEGD